MTEAQKRALALKEDIEKACMKHNLNLTIYDGKIGFVDQKEKRIVMVWSAEYSAKNILQTEFYGGKNYDAVHS